MTTYKLNYHDNHLIADIDNRKVLVDTGSHVTISRDQLPIEVCGTQYPTYDKYLGVTVDQLNHFVGTEFDILLGMDVMRNYNMEVDQDVLTLDKNLQYKEPKAVLPTKDFMGFMPLVVEVGLNGSRLDLYWDTGAKINYLPKHLVAGHPKVGEGRDFFPGYGFFDISIHLVPCTLGDEVVALPTSYLPDDLKLINLLGSELFKHYTVQFRFLEKEIWLI